MYTNSQRSYTKFIVEWLFMRVHFFLDFYVKGWYNRKMVKITKFGETVKPDNIKVTFSINENVLSDLDRLAADANMNRSAFIALMVMLMSHIKKDDFLEMREFVLCSLSANIRKGNLVNK